MPSASAKLEKQTSMETYDPMKQIVTIVEKKVRNLEKRKGKLDSYRQDSQNGKELNDDQKKAVEKYDQVVELLDFAKDLQKQFQGVVQETSKAQKKAVKREQLERQQLELQRIKEIMIYQDLLNSMGGEDVRQDFLDGNKGAVKLSEKELNSMDELYKVICPERDTECDMKNFDGILTSSAEHVQALLDSKNKEAFGTNYKALRETLQKIYSCNYFNKAEDAALVGESLADSSVPDEKETEEENENVFCSEVEDFVIVHQKEDISVVPPTSSQYYPMESSSLYTEQPHPIQEVLSGQGNLNFLQESQIKVGTTHPDPSAPSSLPVQPSPSLPATYANMQQYSSSTMAQQHRTRTVSEEAATVSNHSPTANIMLTNSGSLQQQVPIPTNIPVTQAADFDPCRPIPTQTYTNQSFSSVVHPMMAVPQNFVPVTLSHSISPAHVLPANMVVQPLSPRNVATSSVSNPNTMAQPPVSGLTSMSALSQQANIYSLCLKMNQLNTEGSQPAPMQYETNEIQESNVNKHAGTFGNSGVNHTSVADSRSRAGSNAYSRTGQVEYENERAAAYQSTNNNQVYMNRESFSDNSSYSGNLKRGLSLRGGSRGGPAPRGSSMPRGGRVGYRN